MNLEQSQKETSIESTIKKIKKSEAEKEVRDAAEEFETGAVAEAIKDEMPAGKEDKDEFGITAETEKLVKEMELNPEAKERKDGRERLKRHIAEIQEIVKKYDAVDLINPSGRITEEGRLTYKEEIKIFKEKIKKDPNYNPTFTYPQVEEIKIDDIESKIKDLGTMRERIGAEENNEHIKRIVFECIDTSLAEMNFIMAVKNEDDAMAYQYSAEAFGDIDKELVTKNETYYQNKLKVGSYIDNPLRKGLKEIKLSSQDLKDILQIALDVLGLSSFKINLKSNVANISISDTRKEIKIPENNEYTGERVVEIVSHEICTHAISMMNFNEAGFQGVSIGKNATTFQEGIAMLSEEKAGEHIFGDKKPIDKDWFIHAMEYRREGNGFGATYLEMKKRISDQFIAQDIEPQKAEMDAEKESLNICRRIFRGMHDFSSNSSYYYTKDSCYFRGFIESQKMAEKGLDHYLTDLKVDPYLLPYFLSLKVVPEKALYANRKVIEAIWDKKGFTRDFLENYDWYKENTQMDRHVAYRREFGQIDEEVDGIKRKMEEKNDKKILK